MQRLSRSEGATFLEEAAYFMWDEMNSLLVMREYHDLETAVQRRRVFTGNLWSMSIMIPSNK